MTHPHSDQRNVPVYQRPAAFSPYPHLVNAPVSPLDRHTSAPIPQHYSARSLVVDGEILTSTLVIPAAAPRHTHRTPDWALEEPTPRLWRRVIDDPYWILMILAIVLALSITATGVYGLIQITLAISHWFTTSATTLATIIALITLLVLWGGATAVKCAGIHCGGCRG